jgi:hypothetical protein
MKYSFLLTDRSRKDLEKLPPLTVQNELLIKLNRYLMTRTARQNDAKDIRITINVSDPTALFLKSMMPNCGSPLSK